MGTASVLVARAGRARPENASAVGQPGTDRAQAAFAVQLALNLGWSILFFGAPPAEAPPASRSAALWVFNRRDRHRVRTCAPLAAGLLLLPYLAWTSFAGLLNAEIIRRNPRAWAGHEPPYTRPREHDRRRRPRPRGHGRAQHVPGPRPLLRASWAHGEGHRLYDTDGRAYLDFANGIAVTALGHHHPRVTAAIHAQVDKLIGPIGRDRLQRAGRDAGDDAGGDAPRPARRGHVPQLGLRGDRRRAEARPPGDRPARDHRVPRRRSTAGRSARRA